MESNILSGVWPEWKIVRRINRGSYGVVYEAARTDHGVESRAAIKVISIPQDESEYESLRSAGLTADASKTYFQKIVNDFVSEIQIMESFKGSQNIVSVEDYKVVEKTDMDGWDIFIRMELLTPLNDYLSNKTLSEKEVIKLGCDICSALERCAKRNVIHRDIKPDNIFVNEFNDYKLGDFGIARRLENVTGGLSQKGTYNYMAPEVEKGMNYDATVDIYSLGIVLYWLMNKKRLPFLRTDQQLISPQDLVRANRRRLDGEPLPVPCDASKEMAQVILMASNPDPQKRFATAHAMKNALLSVGSGGARIPAGSRISQMDQTVRMQGIESGDATILQDYTPQGDPDSMTAIHSSNSSGPQGPGAIGSFGGEEELPKRPGPVLFAVIALLIIAVGVSAFLIFGNGAVSQQEKPTKEDTDKADESVTIPQVHYTLPRAVPEEYYYYNGHTYAFYDASRYRFTTYDEVSNFCHDQGGHLAVINDRAENSYLYDLMEENYKITVFFGYTDKDDEGNWVWDGEDSGYENWSRSGDWNLPDNGERWGGGEWKNGGEDYAEFNYSRNTNSGVPNDTTWNDASFMENSTIFFCEWDYDMREAFENQKAFIPKSVSIPDSAMTYKGHSYFIFDGNCDSWEEAREYCKSRGGYLAVINDRDEDDCLFNYMIDIGRNQVFFGLSDADSEGNWNWVSEGTENDEPTYLNWGTNDEGESEPNKDSRKENYAQLDTNMIAGRWNDCAFGWDTSAYICEWDYVK